MYLSILETHPSATLKQTQWLYIYFVAHFYPVQFLACWLMCGGLKANKQISYGITLPIGTGQLGWWASYRFLLAHHSKKHEWYESVYNHDIMCRVHVCSGTIFNERNSIWSRIHDAVCRHWLVISDILPSKEQGRCEYGCYSQVTLCLWYYFFSCSAPLESTRSVAETTMSSMNTCLLSTITIAI